MPQIIVIIADDHEMVRKGIKGWLNAEPDITVIEEVTRGADVLPALIAYKPDVLMLDLHLPDKHGLDVVRELRAAGNATPILVMTGYHKQRARAVLEAGANGFLIKEEKREGIVDAVRWAASGEPGSWISPSAASELMETDSAIEKAELTKTELKVLALIELTNSHIAEKLFLSEGTVKNHITTIYSKLDVKNRIEAIRWAGDVGIWETLI